MVGKDRLFGRDFSRSVDPIAASVLMILTAVAMFSAVRHETRDRGSPPPATNGAKFVARIDGGTSGRTTPPVMPRPTFSVVNWAGTPTRSSFLIDDVAWAPTHDRATTVPTAPFKAARAAHDVRHSTPSPAVETPKPPAGFPQPDLRIAPAPMLTGWADHGLWRDTKAAVRGLLSLGAGLLDHLLP